MSAAALSQHLSWLEAGVVGAVQGVSRALPGVKPRAQRAHPGLGRRVVGP